MTNIAIDNQAARNHNLEGAKMETTEYEKLNTGDELPAASFCLDSRMVKAYLEATKDNHPIYEEQQIVPPLAILARCMAVISSGLTLPPGTIHVSQELNLLATVNINEVLTSYASVKRKIERGKFRLLNIGIRVLNEKGISVLTGECSFMLPSEVAEAKQ
jgi:acyl dehydratase